MCVTTGRVDAFLPPSLIHQAMTNLEPRLIREHSDAQNDYHSCGIAQDGPWGQLWIRLYDTLGNFSRLALAAVLTFGLTFGPAGAIRAQQPTDGAAHQSGAGFLR